MLEMANYDVFGQYILKVLPKNDAIKITEITQPISEKLHLLCAIS